MSKDKDITEKVKIFHKILSWIVAECMNESFLFFVLHNQLSVQFGDFPLYNGPSDFDEIEL